MHLNCVNFFWSSKKWFGPVKVLPLLDQMSSEVQGTFGMTGPCLLTDQDEMSNLYRGPSIDASYQVSVHLAKRFQRRLFKISQSETRIACGGHAWICLLMDQDEMSNRYRGPSIDASYQVWVHLAKRFQRRRFF